MYDSDSARKLLQRNGFQDIRLLKAGETTIEMFKKIDLYVRQEDSLYIECYK